VSLTLNCAQVQPDGVPNAGVTAVQRPVTAAINSGTAKRARDAGFACDCVSPQRRSIKVLFTTHSLRLMRHVLGCRTQAARHFQPYFQPVVPHTRQAVHWTMHCGADPRTAPSIGLKPDVFLCDVRSDAPWTPDSAGSTGGTPPPMMPASARGARGPLAEFCVDLGDACPSLTVHGSRVVAQMDGAPAPGGGVVCRDLMLRRVGLPIMSYAECCCSRCAGFPMASTPVQEV